LSRKHRGSIAVIGLAAALLLSGTPDTASADWAALSWDACGAEVLAKQFACDTNVGRSRFVVSARTETLGPQGVHFECELEIVLASSVVPAWWQLSAGECRPGAIAYSADEQPEDAACQYPWFALPSLSIGMSVDPAQPRIALSVLGVDVTGTNQLPPSVESFVLTIGISHEKSVGDGACAGCSTEACILLRRLTLIDYPDRVNMPLLLGHDMLAWQSTSANCTVTPTRNRTWGAIKSLYR